MVPLFEKFRFLYNTYVLAVLTIGYVLGELGHYLIGVTSKQTAIELDYGEHACQQNTTDISRDLLDKQCSSAKNETECNILDHEGVNYCEWNYNGLGLDYQLLAGPSFILVFTIMGIVLGVVADKFNRVRLLSFCTLVFGVAIILQGSVEQYWQLVVLRMIMAAGESGCNPLATGVLSDIFPEEKRALVMAIFNWGIYGGYGIAFPVGRYVSKLNLWNLGWRVCYYGTGVLAVLLAIITGTTLKEPERQAIGEDASGQSNRKKVSLYKVLTQPRIIMLAIAASIRHCGGMTFAYNADLYYNNYFPDVDLGWWLFGVTIGIGSIGVVVGGVVSDKIVAKMGIKSRVAVLAISQLISTPGAFGSVYFDPFWAMVTLGFSYFFAEMWFGIVFAVLVEIVPFQVRSTTVGIFLFVMNNVGGNLPILVDPVAKYVGYRTSIAIFYAGFYLLSSILFFITMFVMEPSSDDDKPEQKPPKVMYNNGHDNRVFVGDSTTLSQPHLSRPQNSGTTNSYYPNGQQNGHHQSNENPHQQSIQVIENSRL